MTGTFPRSHQRQQPLLHNHLIACDLSPSTSQWCYAIANSLRSIANTFMVTCGLRPRAPQLLWLATINRS